MGDKSDILMKSNKLIKTKYNLSATENKVFQLILFHFQKYNDNTMIAKIPKQNFEKILKTNNHKTEKGISNILLKLRKSDIWIMQGNDWDNYGFINKFGYKGNTNTFVIEMHKEVYDLIINYLNGYVPINLNIFLQFKYFYTQKMYELLRLWSNTKTIISYTIDELRELLMLENKYPIYRDFKKRVIVPAVKELNEKANMQVDFNENRTGRKVTSIDFVIKDNDKRKYFKNDTNNKISNNNQYKVNNKTLRFNDYDQRTYDYDDLEKKLLGWIDD